MADQELKVVDPNPTWADRFAEQQMVVEDLLRQWLTGPVEHIGSTAVPGLRAKPVIDMLAPVGSLTEARAAVPVLADAGWVAGRHRSAAAGAAAGVGAAALSAVRSASGIMAAPGGSWR